MRLPAYQIRCKNSSGAEHRIKLPLPKDVTLGTHKPLREGSADLVCPTCRHLYSYAGTEVVHSFEEILDFRRLPPDPVPMRIEVACDQAGCGVRHVLYTVRAPEETTGAALERVRGSVVNVKCASGHPLALPDARTWKVTEGPNCNPF